MKPTEREERERKQYTLWFLNLPGVGSVRGNKLLSLCGQSPRQLYYESEKLWRLVLSQKQWEQIREFHRGWRLSEEYERLENKGIGLVDMEDEEYPMRLRNIPDPPYGLFYKGRLPGREPLSVAVIGARDCSPYGKYVARELGRALGERGIPVISGMARGIDGYGQEAALSRGGSSYAVLGCGVDICYPAQNRRLYELLVKEGGILSPYPPGTPPRQGNFPARNRIVSGLSDAVVVVEAREKSGTLITVDMALEQGRDVYAVPGRVTERLSDGCNRLIKQGAGIFLSPEMLLEELTGRGGEGREAFEALERENLSPKTSEVFQALELSPLSLEEIRKRLAFSCSVNELTGILMELCLKGLAEQLASGYFSKTG